MKKKHIVRHKDGSVWAKGSLTNGKTDGYWEWFRKNGTKMRSGHFRNGKQVGEWITYDKKGKVYKITQMKLSMSKKHLPQIIKKARKGKRTICSRGHTFYKSVDRPVCPLCWPGRYRKNSSSKTK